MPEARTALDDRHPGGAEFDAAGLRRQERQHPDPDAHVEEMQSGQDEVVEEEVVGARDRGALVASATYSNTLRPMNSRPQAIAA